MVRERVCSSRYERSSGVRVIVEVKKGLDGLSADEIALSQNKVLNSISPRENSCIIPCEDVIRGGGNFVGTCSLFVRKKAHERKREFFKITGMDYALQINGSLNGGMLYINDCMSCYRRMTSGSFSERQTESAETNKTVRLIHHMLKQLNIDTAGKYQNAIRDAWDRFFIYQALEMRDFKALKKRKNKYTLFNGSKKMFFITHFPFLYSTLKMLYYKITKRSIK